MPVLGVCGRDSGSAFGRFGACTETTVQPTPAFTVHWELRARHARACLGAASGGSLCAIIHRLMSFLKFGCLREGALLNWPARFLKTDLDLKLGLPVLSAALLVTPDDLKIGS